MMYPLLEFDTKIAQSNVALVKGLCDKRGIELAGVVKGCNAYGPFVEVLIRQGIQQIASSRLEQLKGIKATCPECETMLLRIPMMSELELLLAYADISVQSEQVILERLNGLCAAQKKRHRVLLMFDLGDLREGFFDENELIEMALKVERDWEHLHLEGIGTNIGCYGAVKATPENLGRLVKVSKQIESLIGRPLDKISGGATSSLPLVVKGNMPEGINHLRIGEGLMTCREIGEFYEAPIEGLRQDAFVLKAEVVEVKNKPTHPIGELFYDAFGNKPTYEDRGIKQRVILGVGRQDFGSHEKLIALDPKVEIIGSSSDHLIVETECLVKVGEVMTFLVYYPALLYLTESPYVIKQEVLGGI